MGAIKGTRICPLADAADPPANEFVGFAAIPHNTVHSNDFSFQKEIDEPAQEEPAAALDPGRAGLLAAIGIVKGQKFDPDEWLPGLLAKAAPIAAAVARVNIFKPRDPADAGLRGPGGRPGRGSGARAAYGGGPVPGRPTAGARYPGGRPTAGFGAQRAPAGRPWSLTRSWTEFLSTARP